MKRKNPNSKAKYNPMWTISSVKKNLKNQMYVGDMVQSVQTKVSYKSKKKKSLISKLDMLYQDKFNGIVSEEMNLRIFRETENSLVRKREKIQSL